jgi:cytochrome c oxidase subunit 2
MPSNTTIVIDEIMAGFIWFSVIAFVLTMAVMVYFLFRYHHRRNPKPSSVPESRLLELSWLIIPSLIGVAMFWFGWTGFSFVTGTGGEDAMIVDVEAYQFGWEYTYENGATAGELRVPVDRQVQLNITSRDVIHNFYAPAFRIKMDAVPGMTNRLTFTPSQEGNYEVLCAEYCGLGHSSMLSEVVVMPETEFESWYAEVGQEAETAQTE